MGPRLSAARSARAALPLAFYATAWRAALGPLRAAAALDRLARRLRRNRGLFPERWLLDARLGTGPRERGPRAAAGPATPVRAGEGPVLWMHAASLGECKGLWALAEGLLAEAAPFGLLLTASTGTGLAYLEGRLAELPGAAARAALAPLDHPGLVERFLEGERVAVLVLCEAELWPNWIRASVARKLPVLLVSARLPERTAARLRRLPAAWGGLLDGLAWIQAQGEADAERFRALTRAPISVGADFKAAAFLREAGEGRVGVPRGREDAVSGAPAREDRIAFVSLHLAELDLILPGLPGLMARHALTVFPRRPEEFAAFRARLLPLGFRPHREDPGARHALVDAFGLVGRILPRCHSAFVGGSLVPKGCHNLWEPLLAGLFVRFGPSVHHQEDLARALLAAGLAEQVGSPEALRAWPPPDAGRPAACGAFARARLSDLEAAEAAFRARVADAMRPFYLFSGAGTAGARSVPRDKGT